jgi:[methyl-Co(III) methanol-specific corrinoid protein]:coenzyme M methyltransferase
LTLSRSRADVLALLSGHSLNRLPVFSGLPSLTAGGLAQAGVRYAEAHHAPDLMARAAASTFERFGFEAAVVPFDLCVEAEALGGEVDFQEGSSLMAPAVKTPLAAEALTWPEDVTRLGRLPMIAQALRTLSAGVGRQVAVGAWIPGPFTLAWQLFGTEAWLTAAGEVLNGLADLLAKVGRHYREAGADFLTVHEMGGSPQAVGPRLFRALVQPALARLMSALPHPNVLSMCGDTNAVVPDLAACKADALHVDQRNQVDRTRAALGPGAVLLGNVDPVAVLSEGTPETVAEAVRAAQAAGVNAIWPGCDLWPQTPDANIRALVETVSDLPGPLPSND